MTTKDVVSARPGLLFRLKVSEPVRLYSYSLLSAVLVALVVVGTITEEWQAALTGIAAAVLGVVPAAEASRASVYSEKTHIQQMVTSRGSWVVDRAA
jgi:hypothetical protein